MEGNMEAADTHFQRTRAETNKNNKAKKVKNILCVGQEGEKQV